MVSSVSSSSSYDRTSMTSQIAQKLFKKLDTNGDGGIDKTELSAIAGTGQSSDISQIFTKMDSNGDGKIDSSENENAIQKIGAKMEAVFKKAGGMSGNMPSPPDPEEMFSSIDTDESGGIDESEFSTFTKAQGGNGPSFSDIDTDSDGSISKDENANFMKKMGPPPGGPPPGGAGPAGAAGGTTGSSSTSSTSKNSFSDLLNALQSAYEEDDDDETSSSIQQLFNELKSSIKYSAQGSLSQPTSGSSSLFSLVG